MKHSELDHRILGVRNNGGRREVLWREEQHGDTAVSTYTSAGRLQLEYVAAVCSDYEVTGDRDNDDDDRSFMFAGVEPSAA